MTSGFLQSIFAVFKIDVFIQICNVATNIFLANILGPEYFGLWIALLLVPNLSEGFGRLKVEIAQVYFVRSKQMTSDRAIQNVNALNLISVAILLLLLTLFENEVIHFFGIASDQPLNFTYYFLVGAVGFNTFLYNAAYFFLSLDAVKKYNCVLLSRALLMLIGVLCLFVFDLTTVLFVSVVYFLSYALPVCFVYGFSNTGVAQFSFSKGELIELICYAIPLYAGGIISQVGESSIRFFGLKFLDLASMSYFFNAQLISKLASKFIDPVMTLLLAELSSHKDQKKVEITNTVFRLVFLASAIASTVVFLSSDFIITLLYDEAFFASVGILKFLSFSIVFMTSGSVLVNYINARGTPGINSWLSFISYSFLILLLANYDSESSVEFLAECYVKFSALHLALLIITFVVTAKVSVLDLIPRYKDLIIIFKFSVKTAIKITKRKSIFT